MSARPEWRRGLPVAPMSFVGTSVPWTRAVGLAERYAPTGLSILLVGATGTGKEVLAQHIHQLSRRSGELVDVNCGALPRDMTESLLFGHRRGAFTGAFEDRPGLVAQAAGGTLFLDELSSMSRETQAKLLRVLETGEVRRLGDHNKQRVDFRVVAAVQGEPEALVEEGFLRPDLYHRVAAAVIRLPCLLDRPEDIGDLAAHFAAARGVVLAADVGTLLRSYDWPGNVRELRAVIERAAVLTEGRVVTAGQVAEALYGFEGSPGPRMVASLHDESRHTLLDLWERHEGDAAAIARAVGVSKATLYRRLKAAGIKLKAMKLRGMTIPRSQLSHDCGETT